MRLKELTLADFPFQTTENVRYRDTDRQGHVNNAVFGTYFEAGRVGMLYQPNLNMDFSQSAFVVAKITMELRGEIVWPNKIRIGVGILHTSSTSLLIGSNLYVNETLVATSETLVVHIDYQTKKSAKIPENLLQKLQSFLIK
jgi:acyl-CoA thioester hydrolase